MDDSSRFSSQLQRDHDLVDFPVSDTYRDWFALQNMTFPSGRPAPERRRRQVAVPRIPGEEDFQPTATVELQEIKRLKDLLREKERIIASQRAELVRLRSTPRGIKNSYAGVIEDGEASGI